MTSAPFDLTNDGRESSKHLLLKVGLLLEELHNQGKIEANKPSGEISLELNMVNKETHREYHVLLSNVDNGEGTKTNFASNNIETEEELLQLKRDAIQWMVRELDPGGLDRVNARYGLMTEQDEPQGQC